MVKLQAVNNVIIIKKDKSYNIENKEGGIMQVPEPYTGFIDSIGCECEYNKNDYVAFESFGSAYMKIDDNEYAIITPNMIIGKLN